MASGSATSATRATREPDRAPSGMPGADAGRAVESAVSGAEGHGSGHATGEAHETEGATVPGWPALAAVREVFPGRMIRFEPLEVADDAPESAPDEPDLMDDEAFAAADERADDV